MNKHTKRPWKYAGNTTISKTDPIFHYASVICGGKRIARVTGIGESEAMANACLIAAAPELLKACKLMQTALTEYQLRDVKKRYSLCIADAVMGKAIHMATKEFIGD